MKIYKILVLVTVASALIGCQKIDQQQAQRKRTEADQKLKAAVAVCKKGELTRKNALERADCIGAAKRQFGYEINYPVMWSLEQDIADDHATAAKYASGKISKEEADEETHQHWIETLKNDASAQQQAQQVRMQNQQQNIQTYQAIQGLLPKPQPMPQPYMMPQNTPINTNCTSNLGVTHCTSY